MTDWLFLTNIWILPNNKQAIKFSQLSSGVVPNSVLSQHEKDRNQGWFSLLILRVLFRLIPWHSAVCKMAELLLANILFLNSSAEIKHYED